MRSEGTDEHLEGHQRADRVAGKGDDRRTCHPPDALGHSGLHRHLDEFDTVVASPVVSAAERVFDHLVGSGTDTAAGDDQVGVHRVPVKDRAELRDVVAGGCGGDHSGARIADGSGQHDRVGLVDLTRL